MAVTTGLLAFWNNNGGVGQTLADATGNITNPNNLSNPLAWSSPSGMPAGLGSACLYLPGTYFAELQDGGSPYSQITMGSEAVWFKTPGTGSTMFLLGKRQAYTLWMDGSGHLGWFDWGGTGFHWSTAVFSDDIWHLALMEFAGLDTSGSATVYVDGSPTSVISAPMSQSNNGNPLNLGLMDNGTQQYTGYLGAAGLWNVAVSPADFATLYAGGAGITYPFPSAAPPPSLLRAEIRHTGAPRTRVAITGAPRTTIVHRGSIGGGT